MRSCNDCPDTNEIYPGINGKTQGDKKLIKPAPIAIKYSVISNYFPKKFSTKLLNSSIFSR